MWSWELVPTISNPKRCVRSEPATQAVLWTGSKGPFLKVVACFTLDTVLSLLESLPCPGDDGVPLLG